MAPIYGHFKRPRRWWERRLIPTSQPCSRPAVRHGTRLCGSMILTTRPDHPVEKSSLSPEILSLHRGTGEARVRIKGKDHYLGEFGSPHSRFH